MVNTIAATSGAVIQCDGFDYGVDQSGSAVLFGFLKKFPKSTALGDTITSKHSLGSFLFLPQTFSDTGAYRYVQGFSDGTVRYLNPSNVWTTIDSGRATNYHNDFESYSTRDVLYFSNGADDIMKWVDGWASAVRIKDKGGTATAITGTLTFTDDSTIVTGSGTAFTTELAAGDYIRKNSTEEYFEVNSVTDNTTLKLRYVYAGTTGAGSAGGSQKAPNTTINGRYLKIWQDRLVILGGVAFIFALLKEDGDVLLTESSDQLLLN